MAHEQIGSPHECFSDLLHAINPRTLIRIACAAGGLVARKVVTLRPANPRIEVPGLRTRARGNIVDLVFTQHAANGRTVGVWVLEIQCAYDRRKRRQWVVYLGAYAAQHDADARLVVFCPEPELRRKIRTRLLPRVDPPAIMIEPDHIERITDYVAARRRPQLTILGCLFHSHEPASMQDRVAVFRAAWIAIQSLAGFPSLRYAVLVMAIVPPAVSEQGLEELREAGELEEDRFEEFMEIERKGSTFHRGREEGREEGHRAMLRRALIDVLELRGFALTAALRRRIDSCTSLETLERWYERAKAAAANQSLRELLR